MLLEIETCKLKKVILQLRTQTKHTFWASSVCTLHIDHIIHTLANIQMKTMHLIKKLH